MSSAKRRHPAPTAADLRSLARIEGPVLSLLLPVTAAVPDVAQNRVRHERVVAEGLARMKALGVDDARIARARDALAPFASDAPAPLPSIAGRAAIWSEEAGLRVFGLPFGPAESVRCASAAAMRPLARAAQRPHRYRVLVLSVNQIALYEGDEDGLGRMEAPELPASLEAALGSQLSDPSLQFHSTGSSGSRPVYHGHGGAARAREIDLARLYPLVARGLESAIGDDVVPLVLAADVQHRPGLESRLHRDVGLIPAQLEGNAEHHTEAALHAASWPLIEKLAVDAAAEREAAGRRRPLLTDPAEIAAQAVMGRIRTLWVPATGGQPGRVDPESGSLAEGWGDDDLIDSLCAQVLRRAGDVRVVEGSDVAAELR